MNDFKTTLDQAKRNCFRAIARGDLQASLRWILVMSYLLKTARKLNDLARTHAQPRRKPKKPAPPAPVKVAPSLPVMLDPEGFSPGGSPNRYLNTERLTRAGLPGTMAAELWAKQQKK